MLLLENRALLDDYRRGDRTALTRVFEHYGPRVLKWVSVGFSYNSRSGRQRFSGFDSTVDTHDTIHDVFRTAFEERARTGYSGLKPFEGYLFVITRNIVLKKLGVNEPQPAAEPEQLERLHDPDPSPEEQVAQREQQEIVRAFLATLNEADRRFVELRFCEQQSQAAVGEALEWSRKKIRIKEQTIRKEIIRFFKRSRGTAELREALHDGA